MLGRTYVFPFARFASVDPARDGWNLYGYVGQNPMGAVDPTGRRAEEPGLFQLFLDFFMKRADAALPPPEIDNDDPNVQAMLEIGETPENAQRLQPIANARQAQKGINTALAISAATVGIVSVEVLISKGTGTLLRPFSGSKLGQQIARFRKAGGKGGRSEFLEFATDFARRAETNGTAVTGTVGSGAQAVKNATVFRNGTTFLVVDDTGAIRSFVPRAIPNEGIVLEYLRLGGK